MAIEGAQNTARSRQLWFKVFDNLSDVLIRLKFHYWCPRRLAYPDQGHPRLRCG